MASITDTHIASYTEEEYNLVINACRNLPPAMGNYLIDNYIENLLLTVLDLQLHTTTVVRAMNYFNKNVHHEVNSHDQLKGLFVKFPDTEEGNVALASYLWGYRYGTRAARLRGLLVYFEGQGVTDQTKLVNWSKTAHIKDFEGKIKGLRYAAFQWLVIRQGKETIKPDSHVNRFVEKAVGHPLSDHTNVTILERAAKELNIKAYELDWRIWEQGRKNA
jgi:hypothetical protein